MSKERKRYRVVTARGREWKRSLTDSEVQQFRQSGFGVEEIEQWDLKPNRQDHRRNGLHLGARRKPRRTGSLRPKRGEK